MPMLIIIDSSLSRIENGQFQVWWNAFSNGHSMNGFTVDPGAAELSIVSNSRIEADVKSKMEAEFGVPVTNPIKIYGGRTS